MDIEAVVGKAKSVVAERWPDLSPALAAAASTFADHIRSLGGASAGDALHLDELALAFLCAQHDKAALDCFEREYIARLPMRLGRLAGDRDTLDDILQRTRQRLLTPQTPGARLRMLDYSGRGSLLGWVQVAATRLALNLRKQEAPDRHVASDDLDLVGATDDPSLQLLKERHRADFKAAFAEAIAALPEADRALLRMYHVEDLTLVQIATLIGLDKSNVSRRLTAVRERLFDDTRRALERRLQLGEGEFDSLMNAIGSQLHVSLSRILRK